MPIALVIYIIFLLIEGGLAWLVSGNPFLLAAVSCGIMCYAIVWKRGGPWGEIVRALAAGLIAVAGPLYYKASLLPTLLCFLALPHLLAATQCFWEIALGKDPTPQNLRMRSVVFTVAFYAAMGLVFILMRGAEPLTVWITAPLAVLVLVLAIPAWDLARVTRLKPGRLGQPVPLRVKARRLILITALLGALAAFFSGVLPAAAEKLCAVSPRWRLKADTPETRPPHEDKRGTPEQHEGPALRPGLDNSAMTGRHQLPQTANIQATGEIMIYLRPKDPAQAAELKRRDLYVRSHTLDEWKDGAWSPSVITGHWIEDAEDGAADGMVTLQKAPEPSVPHTIFMSQADGYSLPALQNVTALGFPRVYAQPGDYHQIQTAGPVRYDAVSAPLNWTILPDPQKLRAGRPHNPAQISKANSRVLMDLIYGGAEFDKEKTKTLAQQIAAVEAWLTKNIDYSTVIKGDPNLTPLDNFLIGEKRGFCDFFATAGALMLRYYDVPTRVAYGYAGHRYDESHNIFIFSDETAHAWTEIFVEGYGWTICDFTPPGHVGHLGGAQEPVPPPFNENEFAQQNQPKPDAPDKPAEQKPDEAFSLSEWWKETMTKLSELDSMERAKQTLTWLALTAAVYFLGRFLWRKKKNPAENGEAAFTADEKQPAYFAEFLRIFQEAGCPRRQGSTPREYLTAVRTHGLGGDEFVPMMEYHYAHRYEDADRDRDREESWLHLARATAERLRQNPSS